MWSVVVLGGESILLLFIGVMAAGCWLELGVVASGRLQCTISMLKSIGDI